MTACLPSFYLPTRVRNLQMTLPSPKLRSQWLHRQNPWRKGLHSHGKHDQRLPAPDHPYIALGEFGWQGFWISKAIPQERVAGLYRYQVEHPRDALHPKFDQEHLLYPRTEALRTPRYLAWLGNICGRDREGYNCKVGLRQSKHV